MNKNLIKINIALLIIMLVFDVWYMFGGGLFAKTIASMMFVMVGVINFYHCSKNIHNYLLTTIILIFHAFLYIG